MSLMYPAADKSLYFGRSRPGVTMTPEKIVLHTTEGGHVVDYNAGRSAPNFTVDNVRGVVYQHYPVNMSARALAHPAGTPATNGDGAVQIEIIGTCDPRSTVRPYLPGLDVSQMGPLVALLTWISEQTGIPLVSTPRPWVAYPASYGARAAQRMGWDEWDAFRGVCGHQHVPGNDHGDPGSLDVPALLAAARGKAGAKHVTSTLKADPRLAAKYAGDLARELPWGAYPLPRDHWFGADDGTPRSHSGARAADQRPVRQVQRAVGAPADGRIGPVTVAAIKRWQVAQKLTADGLFGPACWAKAAA